LKLKPDAHQKFRLIGIQEIPNIRGARVVRVADFRADAEERDLEIQARAQHKTLV
jgi:hypothetical protein